MPRSHAQEVRDAERLRRHSNAECGKDKQIINGGIDTLFYHARSINYRDSAMKKQFHQLTVEIQP